MPNAERNEFPADAAFREEYMTLSDYLAQVQGLIEDADGLPGWIVCELAKVSWSRGHCYLEMVEGAPGGITLAKARGTIWSYKANVLNNIFRLGTGDELKAGIKVMMYVQVQFSPIYGMSLNVLDINPSYTLGDLEAQRRATVARLDREGLLERNKELEVPLLPYRIAVVSASGAAGYGDFMKHLSDSGVRFEVELFEAAVQGADAPSSIAEAFERINARAAEFDVAVLIRGGGSNLDLACFDDYQAAKAVALCNLPVISGIGHERDNHVCDDVASVRVKTPTGAADFLIQRFADAFEDISSLEERIIGAYSQILEDNGSLLGRLSLRLSSSLSSYTEERSSLLKECYHRIYNAVYARQMEENHRFGSFSRRMEDAVEVLSVRQENILSNTGRRVAQAVLKRMMVEDHRLDRMQALFEGADPSRILDRGYGIVIKDGLKVSDISQITEGSRLTIVMRDGKVTFTASNIAAERKEQ